MKQNLVGNGFLHIPKNEEGRYMNRINVIGEIVSAEGFLDEELYTVFYLFSFEFYYFV